MKLSDIVTVEDVEEATRLMIVATQTAVSSVGFISTSWSFGWEWYVPDFILAQFDHQATDPKTGKIDMDMLQTGHSSAERQL